MYTINLVVRAREVSSCYVQARPEDVSLLDYPHFRGCCICTGFSGVRWVPVLISEDVMYRLLIGTHLLVSTALKPIAEDTSLT